MNIDYYLNIVYFVLFLFMLVVTIKILFESNLHQLFKQGKLIYIRLTYLFIAIVFSHLFSDALVQIIRSIYQMISL